MAVAGRLRAWRQGRAWLDAEPAWVPSPTSRHGQVLGRLVTTQHLRGNLVSDAHVAALAIEHGLQLCSADRDFTRFPEVRRRNPLGG